MLKGSIDLINRLFRLEDKTSYFNSLSKKLSVSSVAYVYRLRFDNVIMKYRYVHCKWHRLTAQVSI
jgi:hypothetical protein